MIRAICIASTLLFLLAMEAAAGERSTRSSMEKPSAEKPSAEKPVTEKPALPARIKILTGGDAEPQIRVLAHAEPADDEHSDDEGEADDVEADEAQGDGTPGDGPSSDEDARDEAPLADERDADDADDSGDEDRPQDEPTLADGPVPTRRVTAPTVLPLHPSPDHGSGNQRDAADSDIADHEPEELAATDGIPSVLHDDSPADAALPDLPTTADEPSLAEPELAAPASGPTEATRNQQREQDADDDSSGHGSMSVSPPQRSPRQPLPPPVLPANLKPVKFKGVQPLVTNRDGLRAAWGAPKAIRKLENGQQLTYKIEPYEKVIVTVEGESIASIDIVLAKPTPTDLLAKQLDLADIEPAMISDAKARPIGLAYPEKGALILLAPQSSTVVAARVLIENIDPSAFVARASGRWQTEPSLSLADLEQALEMDPDQGDAWELKARLLLQIGRLSEAAKAAQTAVELEAHDPDHRLMQAEIQMALADYPAALATAREISEAKRTPGLLRARAELLWGDCLAHSGDGDYAEAIVHHQQAIRLAESLSHQADPATRIAAKQVLLEAHLGAAHDIGWGNWQQQAKFTQKWIDKALGILDDLVGRERLDKRLRLHAYQRALMALAGISAPPDASRLSELAARIGKERLAQARDERLQQSIAWELGLAMAAAAEINHARGEDEQALQCAQLAAEQLDAGSPLHSESPTHDLVLGEALFRLGALCALVRADHPQAIDWYNRAAPLLESPFPDCAANDPARRGEAFVTMAVSYWDEQQSAEALRLTRQGVALLKQAVELGRAEAEVLAVPYHNLSGMCQELGKPREAREYATLAERLQATRTK